MMHPSSHAPGHGGARPLMVMLRLLIFLAHGLSSVHLFKCHTKRMDVGVVEYATAICG